MINFTLLEKPTPCPSAANCYCFSADPAGDCTLGYERDAGSNACDFVQWINKPASTFDPDAIAKAFGIDVRTIKGVE